MSHPEPLLYLSLRIAPSAEAVAQLDALARSLPWPVINRLPDLPLIMVTLPPTTTPNDLSALTAQTREAATLVGSPAGLHVELGYEHPGSSVPTASELWHYALECLCGRDGLDDGAAYLRRIGSPPALRLAELIAAGDDLVRVELQVSLWFQAGMMSYGLMTTAAITALAEQHELPADLDAETVQRTLLELPQVDRLPYWQE
ncbi:MAG: hypothetical protein WCI67_08980 [Chloroflexales bacterium]